MDSFTGQHSNDRLPASVFQDGFQPFLDYLVVNRNLSPNTLRAYKKDIEEWCGWTQDQAGKDGVIEIDTRDLPARYVSYLSSRDLSRTSLARKISSLKLFFKYMMKERFVPDGTLPLGFHRPKLAKKLPEFLTQEDVQKLLKSVESTDPNDILSLRNQTILYILFTSGIRVSELVALNMEDIIWDHAEMRVKGKGRRERISFISQKALASLRKYLNQWKTLAKGKDPEPNSPVFLNHLGTRLNVRSVRRILDDIGKVAGIEKPMNPHVFRHTFATHLLNKGIDLRVVQELLGHVSIRSTQIYTHLSTERLKQAYMKAHPRANQGEQSDQGDGTEG